MKKTMVILLAVCLFSCGEGNSQSKIKSSGTEGDDNVSILSILEEWRAQKAAWERLGIDHYRYTTKSDGGDARPSPPPHTVTVFPDKEPEWMITPAEEAWYDRHFPGLDWKNVFSSAQTISDIFANIEYDIVRAREDEQVRVRFNERYHYPEEFRMFPKSETSGGGASFFYITAFEDLRE